MNNIERKRGDTYADKFTITSEETGQVENIAGFTFKMSLDTLKAPPDNTTNIYTLDGVIVDAANGVVAFSPSEAQADLVGSFYYDVQMIDVSGKIRTVELARYKYVQDITK